jgi:hypothetical protein
MAARDFYELLGVRREATAEELRRGYETALARASRDGATRHMVDLVEAYEVLRDPGRRRTYDEIGIGVVPERVPNTFGRQVAFRGGGLGLGTARRTPSAPAQTVVPGCPPQRGWGRAMVVVFALGGIVMAVATAVSTLRQVEVPTQTPSLVVPAGTATGPDGRVAVLCMEPSGAGFTLRAVPGTRLSCPNGATPRLR